jgi:hypothetical protein
MKKLILLILLMNSANAIAQDFQLGSGVILYRFNGNYKDQYSYTYPIDQSTIVFNLLFAGYFPVKKMKDELRLGINPNAGIGFFNNSFSVDLPVYITMRYGAGSSNESLSEFGAAFGVGGRFTGFSTIMVNARSTYASSFVSPSVMAQVTIKSGGGDGFSLRADFTPVPINKDKGAFLGQISQYNFLLMRSF